MYKVSEFLNNIKLDDEELYFLLYRFYKNPNVINESIFKKRFFMNNDFIDFLYSCVFEEEFIDNLDLDTAYELKEYVKDSLEYKKIFLKKIMSLKDNSEYKRIIKKMDLINEFSKNKLKRFDDDKASMLIDELDFHMVYSIVPEKSYVKESIINEIINDDYSIIKDCLLFERLFYLPDKDCYDGELFEALLCENKFLSVVEQLMNQNKLYNKKIIDNIISIISTGISIKRKEISDYNAFEEILGEELILSFDIEKASSIISKLTLLKNNELNKFDLILMLNKKH